MHGLLNQLLELMNREVQLHEHLLQWVKEEIKSIGQISGSALLQLHTSKTRCIRKIEKLEQTRMEIVRKLAEGWNLKFESLTLRVLIARVEDTYSLPLQEALDRLTTLVQEIHKGAQRLERLSQARLISIETSLKFLGSLGRCQQTYSDSGTLQTSQTTVSRLSI